VARWRVAPGVRFNVFAIFANGSLRAIDFSIRISSADQERLTVAFFVFDVAFAIVLLLFPSGDVPVGASLDIKANKLIGFALRRPSTMAFPLQGWMNTHGNADRRQDCFAVRARGRLKLPSLCDRTLRAHVLDHDMIYFS
jgi:hypothetical protein